MMAELRQGIIQFLKAHGLECQEFGSKDLKNRVLNLKRPAVNVIINRATAAKLTGSLAKQRYKYALTVSLIIVVEHIPSDPKGESRRREQSEKLIEAIGDTLLGQDFGLELENPLYPLGFNNITTPDWQAAGYMVYQQDFWCSYIIERLEDDDIAKSRLLKSLLAQYTIEPQDAAAEPPELESVISLT